MQVVGDIHQKTASDSYFTFLVPYICGENKMQDLTDYISCGYYITTYVDRPQYVNSKLLPAKILSFSSCISPFFPDDWAISWIRTDRKLREEIASKFGLHGSLDDVISFLTSEFDRSFGSPNVLYSLETAREFVRRFSLTASEITILGFGLHRSLAERCIKNWSPVQQAGYAPIGNPGILDLVLKAQCLNSDGRMLGFEPVSFDESGASGAHSWLCNGLETEVKEKFGIIPNRHGFLNNFEDGLKATDYISLDEVGAEPGLWVPLLGVQYEKS